MKNVMDDTVDATDARIYRRQKRRIAHMHSRLGMHPMDPDAPNYSAEDLDEHEREIDRRFQ